MTTVLDEAPLTTSRKNPRAIADKSYTPAEFAHAERISRGMLYKLWKLGEGPRFYFIGNRRRITEDARAEWRAEREAKAARTSNAKLEGDDVEV